MILHSRHLAWIALFELFQQIHPKKPIPAKEWQTLSFLIETLREKKRLDDWAAVSRASTLSMAIAVFRPLKHGANFTMRSISCGRKSE
jgi:hypothetical protein